MADPTTYQDTVMARAGDSVHGQVASLASAAAAATLALAPALHARFTACVAAGACVRCAMRMCFVDKLDIYVSPTPQLVAAAEAVVVACRDASPTDAAGQGPGCIDFSRALELLDKAKDDRSA